MTFGSIMINEFVASHCVISVYSNNLIVLCRDELFIFSPWLLYLNDKDIHIKGGFIWVVCKRFANKKLLTNQREIIIAL